MSSFGGSPHRLEIGLGKAVAIEKVEIEWPASKTIQTFEDVSLDSMIEVREGEDTYSSRSLSPFPM